MSPFWQRINSTIAPLVGILVCAALAGFIIGKHWRSAPIGAVKPHISWVDFRK